VVNSRGNLVLECRIERQDKDAAFGVPVAGADGPRQAMADILAEDDRVLGLASVVAERFQNLAQLPDGNFLAEKVLQDLLYVGDFHQGGDQLIDDRRTVLLQLVNEMFGGVAGQELVGMAADDFLQVRGEHGGRLDGGIAEHRGPILHSLLDPNRRLLERGVFGLNAANLARRHAAIDGHQLAGNDFSDRHGARGNLDAVLILAQADVIAYPYLGKDDANFRRNRLPHASDPRQQIAAIFGAREANERRANFDLHGIDGQEVLDSLFGFFGLGVNPGLFGRPCFFRLLVPREHQREPAATRADNEERRRRQVREDQDSHEAGCHRERPGVAEKLGQELYRQVRFLRAAGGDEAGSQRNQERRHLADQSVADGQLGEDFRGGGEVHALLEYADDKSAQDIDNRDDDAGDGITADEFAGTVHSSVKVGLLGDFLAAALGFLLVDDAGIEVGVDGHLPARHAVEGKSGGDFTDAGGTLRDDDELDDDDDDENDDADHNLITSNELTKTLDYASCREQAIFSAVSQNQARRSHVEHEASEGRGQEQRWKDVEFQRRADVDRR
jgi:hypothetical protein